MPEVINGNSHVGDCPSNDTICAIATAPGGAIGIIRLSGPQAIVLAGHLLRRDLSETPGHSVHFGALRGEDEAVVDEVLVTLFRQPRSYTGEDAAEISCHGSPYILQHVMQLLLAAGARQALPGEFTQRAFLNGKLDLSQAEAVADLIASQSAAAHRMALSQLRGGFSRELGTLRDQLLRLTALLELELDFSEEEVEFADRHDLQVLCQQVKERIASLTRSFHTGQALKSGVPVAILGAPNVGKSTLLNALLRDDRAIVSPIQGTTRDLIEDTILLGGIQFRFIDTAGIRHTSDTIEQMGIKRSRQAAQRARILILMSEPGVPEPDIQPTKDQTVIHIQNKTPHFQAINGLGLADLERQLLAAVPTPEEGDTVVTNLRHFEALTLALTDIRRVLQALSTSLPSDLIAQDLRQCLHHLGSITGGSITSNEVLGSIFREFCVGK